MRRTSISLVLLVWCSACVGQSISSGARPFTLAIEYAVPGLASTYAATGLTDAKPQIEFGVWG
ncbi:MAG: hypothetical protein HY318_05335, partial [Armatimonadetes bacterium]|nr:hypothetical protein [Armatimonadota bacterium]